MAFDKLEKQLLKLRRAWRDTKRVRDKEADGAKASASCSPPARLARKPRAQAARKDPRRASKRRARRCFASTTRDGSKPMTLEEAMLEMEASQDYLVYRDAQTDRVTVLMRRSDGHFDLIES